MARSHGSGHTAAKDTGSDPDVAYRRDIRDVITILKSHERFGLTDSEAHARLERVGRIELVSEQAPPAWRRFARQFQDVLVILLLVATAISAGLWVAQRDAPLPYEAIAIFAVLLNAVMGFVQESRAEAAVAALRAMSAADATVVRNGERRSLPASDARLSVVMETTTGFCCRTMSRNSVTPAM